MKENTMKISTKGKDILDKLKIGDEDYEGVIFRILKNNKRLRKKYES